MTWQTFIHPPHALENHWRAMSVGILIAFLCVVVAAWFSALLAGIIAVAVLMVAFMHKVHPQHFIHEHPRITVLLTTGILAGFTLAFFAWMPESLWSLSAGETFDQVFLQNAFLLFVGIVLGTISMALLVSLQSAQVAWHLVQADMVSASTHAIILSAFVVGLLASGTLTQMVLKRQWQHNAALEATQLCVLGFALLTLASVLHTFFIPLF